MSEFPPRGALTVSYGEACDRGKVREENQDSIRSASIPLGDLFIVADGIGGYQGGATASRMVVEGFLAELAARPANYPPDHALAEACNYTNASIHAAANTGDPKLQRMGSTVVMALVQDGSAAGGNTGEVASFGPTAWVGHVGDSRAYLIRAGQMTKITNDHSAVQALINRNLITEEEARNHPDASVLTRSLGHRPDVEIEIDRVPLQAGDSLLLCSDGLWGYVADADIAAVATDPNLSVEKIAEYLLDLALSAGGHDNIGIEFLRIDGSAPAIAPPIPFPARTALRATVPEMSAMPFPRSSAAALTADPPPAPGNRKQILLAVCLLALAIGGGLGLAARNHWLKSNHKQDAPVPSVAGGTTAPPAAEKSSKRQPKSPIQPQPGPSPAGNPRQNPTPGPNPQAADATPRIFGIVGDIQLLGPIRRLTPSEVAMQHTTIRQERKAACVNLATGETVAYVGKPDLSDHVIVDAIVKTYPRVKDHMKAHEVQRKEMTQEIKDACGGDYDAIVILAVQAPPQNDAPTSVPHPADTHDHPASQFKHPHPQSEQEER